MNVITERVFIKDLYAHKKAITLCRIAFAVSLLLIYVHWSNEHKLHITRIRWLKVTIKIWTYFYDIFFSSDSSEEWKLWAFRITRTRHLMRINAGNSNVHLVKRERSPNKFCENGLLWRKNMVNTLDLDMCFFSRYKQFTYDTHTHMPRM